MQGQDPHVVGVAVRSGESGLSDGGVETAVALRRAARKRTRKPEKDKGFA